MCGLVGMAGNLTPRYQEAFRDLLLFDTIRGMDSTGIAYVGLTKQSTPQIIKNTGLPDSLLWEDDNNDLSNKLILKGVKKVIIGHNRAATIGKVTQENAHPFQFKNVVGAHNGTLTFYSGLKGFKDDMLDSYCLLKSIDEEGIRWTWKNFTGAAALTWWNQEDQTINLIRNSRRPLNYAYSKARDKIIWASEAWMIRVVGQKHGLDLEENKDKTAINVFSLSENTLLSMGVTSTTLEDITHSKVEERSYTRPPVTTPYSSGNPHYSDKPHGNQRFRVSSKRKNKAPYAYVNSNWSKGYRSATKDSRNWSFELLDLGKPTASLDIVTLKIKEKPDAILEVMVFNLSDRNKWITWVENGMKHFKSKARLRFARKDGKEVYRVSSLEIIPDGSRNSSKKNKSLDNVTFLHPNTGQKEFKIYINREEEFLSERLWRKKMADTDWGCGCAACGNPFAPEQAEEIIWFNLEKPLCKDCSEDDIILAYM